MAGKSPRAIPEDPNTKRGFLFFLDTYLVWRVPAFLFCLWVVLRWQDIPLSYFPKFNRDLLVIPAILAELYHILRRDKFSVVGFPAYIAVFPVSAVFFLLYDLTRLLMIPIRLFVILKAEYTFYLCVFISAVFWLVSFLSKDQYSRGVFALGAHVFTYLVFLHTFKWVTNPYQPFVRLSQLVEGFVTRLVGGFINADPAVQKNRNETNVTAFFESMLSVLDTMFPDDRLRDETSTRDFQKSILPHFINAFIVIYLLMSVSFSLSLQQVELTWGHLFSNISRTGRFFDYLYFSLLGLLSSLPGNIQPINDNGRLWFLWIIFTGLLLLTFMLGVFTTSFSMLGLNETGKIKANIMAAKDCLRDGINRLEENPRADGSGQKALPGGQDRKKK